MFCGSFVRSGVTALLALVFWVRPAFAELPAEIEQALKQAKISPQNIALVMLDANSGRVLWQHNDSKAMNPASVIKLLTTYVALDLLGSDFTWKTELFADSWMQQGSVVGNLYFKGGGDPKFLAEHLWMLLLRLRGQGLRQIRGSIVIDASLFNTPSDFDAGAFDRRPLRPYNQAAHALLLNFQTIFYHIQSFKDSDKVTISAYPPANHIRIINQTQTSKQSCTGGFDRLRVDLSDPLQPVFSGTYSRECPAKTLNVAIPDYRVYFLNVLTGMFKDLGIEWQGKLKLDGVPSRAIKLGQWESYPLADIVRDINQYSNNVMARQLYLTLSAVQTGVGSTQSSEQLIKQWLQDKALPMPELVMESGAGLSRNTRISAMSLAKLLWLAWKGHYMLEWFSSLPVAGVNGTLRNQTQAAWQGKVRLKTGTLKGVKAFAGLLNTNPQQPYLFVLLINDERVDSAPEVAEKILDWAVSK